MATMIFASHRIGIVYLLMEFGTKVEYIAKGGDGSNERGVGENSYLMFFARRRLDAMMVGVYILRGNPSCRLKS